MWFLMVEMFVFERERKSPLLMVEKLLDDFPEKLRNFHRDELFCISLSIFSYYIISVMKNVGEESCVCDEF